MHRITSLLLFLLPTLVMAEGRHFILEGQFTTHQHDGRTICLTWQDPLNYDRYEVLDSAKVQNAVYRFEGEAPDTLSVYVVRFLPNPADPHQFDPYSPCVLIEPGTIQVKSDPDGMDIHQSGTAHNDDYNRLVLEPNRQMRARHDVLTRECFDTLMISNSAFVRTLAGTPAIEYFFYQYPLDRFPEADRSFILSQIRPELLRREEVRDSIRNAREQYFQESKKALHLGAHYRDIAGITPEGDSIRLSQLVQLGHVTLLDFWASWCGPCRQAIPKFKELYQKYHDKGFDVISVSLDTDGKAWHNAMNKEQMPWPQFSELKGWNGTITQDYGIQAIPYIILLDRHGDICLLNMYEDLLVNAIEKAL